MEKNIYHIDRMNPFEHRGRYGTVLKAAHCDLSKGPNIIEKPAGITLAKFAADMTEIIGWWSLNVYPNFVDDHKGFPGVDCIQYTVVPAPKDTDDDEVDEHGVFIG